MQEKSAAYPMYLHAVVTCSTDPSAVCYLTNCVKWMEVASYAVSRSSMTLMRREGALLLLFEAGVPLSPI